MTVDFTPDEDGIQMDPPKGCVWKRADKLKAGDRCLTETGAYRTVKHTTTANWISTTEGHCVWVYWKGGGDEVSSKSSEYAVKA